MTEILAIEIESGLDVKTLLSAVRQKKIVIAKISDRLKVQSFLVRLISHIKKMNAKAVALDNYRYLLIVPSEVQIHFSQKTKIF